MLLSDTAVQFRSSDLAPERQRALVRLARGLELAAVLEDDPEVVERRGHPAPIADLLADRERLSVQPPGGKEIVLIAEHGRRGCSSADATPALSPASANTACAARSARSAGSGCPWL